jgi:hypothetical protein
MKMKMTIGKTILNNFCLYFDFIIKGLQKKLLENGKQYYKKHSGAKKYFY